MSTTVTLADLESLRACRAQRAIFAATFPEGVTITPTNYRAVAEAVAEAKLNADWYARRVLNGGDLAAYDAAWAEARAAYEAAVAYALCSILVRRGEP